MAEATGRMPGQGFRDLPPSLKIAAYVAAGVCLALVLSGIAAALVVRHPWPETSGELTLDGLDAEVEIVRDDAGIPQIYADTTHDLMLAQGFVHAQDRFYEMDVRRHATAGRLAELFGEAALDSDLVVRTLGWRRVAEAELELLDPATRAALDAYAEGVNVYLADRSISDISLEYSVLDLGGLDYRPEEWTAVDSVAWLKAMAWDLRANVDDEAARTLLDAIVGPERTDQLYPAYDETAHPSVLSEGRVVDGVFDPAATATGSRLRVAPGFSGPGRPDRSEGGSERISQVAAVADALTAAPALLGTGDDLGSNAWVVDGAHTDSGAPILANDPHLGVSLPGVWTQVGLHCRELSSACPYDVAGFSFSGVPGVVIGHNRDIAWGFTNLGADVSDLYVERLAGQTWNSDGRYRPLRSRLERIEVRGEEPVEITVRATRHGPLVSDLITLDASSERIDLGSGLIEAATSAGQLSAGHTPARFTTGVSLAWTALEPRPTMDALFALNRAEDWRSFRTGLSGFAVPGQNVVYADTAGHIGYQATGVIPRRARGHDGTRPVPGHLSRYDWRKPIPYAAMPWALDPPDGVIVTANQQVIDAGDYPYLLGVDWARGYRSTRISELITGLIADEQAVTPAAMESIQRDDLNPFAAVLTPYLLDVEMPAGYYSDGPRLLAGWDGRQDVDSGGAAFFNAAWRQLLKATFDDELPSGLRPDGGARWFDVMARQLQRPNDPWWDDVATEDTVEHRDDIIATALREARDELTRLISPDVDDWTWGRLHRLSLRSATLGESGIAAVERLFNRDGWQVPGGSGLVDAAAWDAREGYDVTSAPSMRMVIGLDDLDDARWINLTGVSGHVFHPNSTDQTDLWARGDYLTWAFDRDAVVAAAEDTLVLSPAD